MDRVVGKDRLPDMKDRDQLPYLGRIITETLRWFPATPLGLPHKSLKDDIFEGYFIPKGTVIFGNALAMTHDPRVYRDPDTFDPDRYLRGEPHPVGQWGFGRRVCVGQHLATSTIYMILATFVATLDIKPELDEFGIPRKPAVVWESGFRGRVDAEGTFKHSVIKFRSAEAQKLLEEHAL